MSQKFSLPQLAKSVSMALIPDILDWRNGRIGARLKRELS